jgi:hypothetical protein
VGSTGFVFRGRPGHVLAVRPNPRLVVRAPAVSEGEHVTPWVSVAGFPLPSGAVCRHPGNPALSSWPRPAAGRAPRVVRSAGGRARPKAAFIKAASGRRRLTGRPTGEALLPGTLSAKVTSMGNAVPIVGTVTCSPGAGGDL